ncbi:MAG: multicopper oxidase domain-containing protein [Desulfuromonadaceae bacterium]|nr:multicopper oxidase domain-containing protein [Desulfuromonadaceae bacterium]MDD2847457.1 multicopper oxidase domain-containing protein [Desulfuromonadaceae bacterium]MDD4131430.1 multicopper oxidase domain-containing protein [Desulfuromonadaceae bacterium]
MKTATMLILGIFTGLMLAGCGKSNTETVAVNGASKTTLLNPLTLQQFATPLPIIPVAAPDTTTVPGSEYYSVVVEQTSGYDFGLRKSDGSDFLTPISGAPIRTTVWGYTTNGIKAGYLGATIVARSTLAGESGKPVVVKYTNNLKNADGSLLTKHLLTVDPTVVGAMGGAMGNDPEIRIVTHLHGGHVATESDGHPNAWITNDPTAMTGLPADPISGRPARPNGNSVTYTYDNSQIANHLWYHDHAMGITRLNVYAGLAGNYFTRDSVEDALNLPSGAYEIPLVIQDKSFNEDGSLHYDSNALLNPDGTQQMVDGKPVFTSNPEFFGNVITVNGKAWPKLDVEPRKYRFRLLNGSDSRFYNIWLERSDGLPVPAGAITMIGNDGGLLPSAVSIGHAPGSALLLALAERADVIIDFSQLPAGVSLTMRNDAHTPYPNGDDVNPSTTGRIMQFKITKALVGTDTSVVPATPRALTPYAAPDNTRYVDLQETEENTAFVFDLYSGAIAKRLMILLNGLPFDAPITENILLNDVEDWVIINNTVDAHPMHLHLVHFEVVEKGTVAPGAYTPADGLGGMPTVAAGGLRPDTNPDGTPATGTSPYTVQPPEQGHKDTVRVPPADEFIGSQGYVRIRARFDRIGTYMWHCHILAHEDHEMMRPFRVQ